MIVIPRAETFHAAPDATDSTAPSVRGASVPDGTDAAPASEPRASAFAESANEP
jgi:hypothetical protein